MPAPDRPACREAVEARDDELAAALGSSEPARVAQACDEVSDTYQQVGGGGRRWGLMTQQRTGV